MPVLFRKYPSIFDERAYNRARWAWAMSIILSRTWGRPFEDSVISNQTGRNQSNVHTLVPAADMPNHDSGARPAQFRSEDGKPVLVLQTNRRVGPGEQVLISYGSKCDLEFLVNCKPFPAVHPAHLVFRVYGLVTAPPWQMDFSRPTTLGPPAAIFSELMRRRINLARTRRRRQPLAIRRRDRHAGDQDSARRGRFPWCGRCGGTARRRAVARARDVKGKRKDAPRNGGRRRVSACGHAVGASRPHSPCLFLPFWVSLSSGSGSVWAAVQRFYTRRVRGVVTRRGWRHRVGEGPARRSPSAPGPRNPQRSSRSDPGSRLSPLPNKNARHSKRFPIALSSGLGPIAQDHVGQRPRAPLPTPCSGPNAVEVLVGANLNAASQL